MSKRLSLETYKQGILDGNRFILSRAISLLESQREDDVLLAQTLLSELLDYTGSSIRIAVTGSPGVGKSTFIESFGSFLIQKGKKVAVLAIDPSSQKTGGSIMGDKTRMQRLSTHPQSFVRPSPNGLTLGGVSRKTRETILICESAGYEVIIVETVGVGQSEVAAKQMVDCFLLLLLAGAGDELQGIKKGIVELADILAITKADKANISKIQIAQNEYKMALKYLKTSKNNWIPKVLTCSALENTDIDKIWDNILDFIKESKKNNYFEENRKNQNLAWLKTNIEDYLIDSFYKNKDIKSVWKTLSNAVINHKLSVYEASKQLINIFKNRK